MPATAPASLREAGRANLPWTRRLRYRRLFRLYRRLFGTWEWMQRRFTTTGRVALGLVVLFAAIGIDTVQAMAFQLFALVASALFIAVIASLRAPPRASVERSLPPLATVGELFSYTIELRNDSARPLHGLYLRDGVDALHPQTWQLQQAIAERRSAAWTERLSGLSFYARIVTRVRGAVTRPVEVPDLMPGERVRLRLTLRPLRRGTIEFTHCLLQQVEPLGLAQATRALPCASRLVVLPRRYPVRRLDLAGSRRFQRGGVQLAAQVGDSEEFMGLRPYRAGDALRAVHWKSWARTGRPVVKEFQDEFFVRFGLVLDTFATVQDEDLFEAAVSVACSLAAAERSSDSLLDLLMVEDRLHRFTAGRGLASTGQLLQLLAGVQRCPQDAFGLMAAACEAQARVLSGAYFVLLAWDDARQQLVRRLLARGLALRVLVLTREPAPPAAAEDAAPVHWLRLPSLAADLARL